MGGLAWGAGWLVEGASRIGRALGLSDLVVGLTIVGFGTSAPELVVSTGAAMEGSGNMAVGNVVGSNIFNLGFVLGGCALVRVLPTGKTVVFRDGLVLLACSILLVLMLFWDLSLSATDGVILFTLLVVYLVYVYRTSREQVQVEEEGRAEVGRPPMTDAFALAGVGLLTVLFGGELLVDSASHLARAGGVSEWTIGVTIVAAGTSAPELATSLVAVIKGRGDMSIGGLVGSDIFNVLGVLGVASMVHPSAIDASARGSLVALPFMVAAAVFFMRTGWKIRKSEGAILVLLAAGRWAFDVLG